MRAGWTTISGLGISERMDRAIRRTGPGHVVCAATVGALLCVLMCPVVYGDWIEQQKLTNLDAAAYHYFGQAVSICGGYAIIGTPYADGNQTYAGAAYVFDYNAYDANWSQLVKLTASDGTEYDVFGQAVHIDGEYAIVGAVDAGAFPYENGAAYVFKREGAAWAEQDKLVASDAANNDKFGTAVVINGDWAAAGAHLDDDNGSNSGAVYIFKRNGTSWGQQQKIVAPDGAAGDLLGASVALAGEYLFISAYYADYNYLDQAGKVYVYKLSGDSWVHDSNLVRDDAAAYEWFGYSVSADGNYAVVGCVYDGDKAYSAGSAYVFKRSDTPGDPNWYQQAKLYASDAGTDDQFGWSVDIDADTIVVGTPWNDDAGFNSDSGSAYVFRRTGTSWVETAKITASDAGVGERFGTSVSVSGETLVAGAPRDDQNGYMSGSAYVFGRTCPLGDLDDDCDSDIYDLDRFMTYWLWDACGPLLYCGGADIDSSGDVNMPDLALFASHWRQAN